MARSKPKFRPKKTGSCPCVQDAKDNDKDIQEMTEKLAQQEPRFYVNDIYHPSDELIDLESYSYSEVSSFGFGVQGEAIFEAHDHSVLVGEASAGVGTGAGIGDQIEEVYISGENVSSGQPEDSEPNENSATFEDRKLNIAATVMSWLDNYGQARGYSRNGRNGPCGTSIMIHPDEVSRIDSGSILDNDEAVSNKSQSQCQSQCQSQKSRGDTDYIVGPDALKQQFTLLETSCSILINFHKDLEPLVKTQQERNQDQYPDQDQSPVNWKRIQDVFSTWANLMSTIWKRSREGNITRGELHSFTRFCENLDLLATQVSPVDISGFANPVVRMSLSRTQGFINLALKWSREIALTGKLDDIQAEVASWNELIKTVSMIVNEQLKFTTISFAKSIIENQKKYELYPKYEILLHDVTPSKTVTGWMFYGKVELRHVENGEDITKQIDVQAKKDSGLRLTFMASIPRMTPCVDYGSLFHIVNRACLEICQYYEAAQNEILRAKQYLNQPLIPPSHANKFGKLSRLTQYNIMSLIITQIIADHTMDPTIKAIDEILRSFDVLIVTVVKVLRKFIKRIKYKDQNRSTTPSPTTTTTSQSKIDSTEPFSELVVPMNTDANTMLFQTVRRFIALGPMSVVESTTGGCGGNGYSADSSSNPDVEGSTTNTSRTSTTAGEATIEGNRSYIIDSNSVLVQVHNCLEDCLKRLYTSPSKNVFKFPEAIQTLYAISQLAAVPEQLKKAVLENSMKNLVLSRLTKMQNVNKEFRNTFRQVVAGIDRQMKSAELSIDKIMVKGTALGITIPARTSGVRFSHRHDQSILIRYNRNSYIRNQAKRLRQSNEVHRHTRKYVVEPDFEEDCASSSTMINNNTISKKSSNSNFVS